MKRPEALQEGGRADTQAPAEELSGLWEAWQDRFAFLQRLRRAVLPEQPRRWVSASWQPASCLDLSRMARPVIHLTELVQQAASERLSKQYLALCGLTLQLRFEHSYLARVGCPALARGCACMLQWVLLRYEH